MFKHRLLSMVVLAGMLLGQSVSPAYAAALCNQAQFVSDITVPDGAAFAPGGTFTKTWRFMNAGTCTWTTSYTLVLVGGDAMGAPSSVNLPVNVPPGQMLDISVNLTAPSAAGHYKSLWRFADASAAQFGIGDSANGVFWADINVVLPETVVYDFVANAPSAQWKSGVGLLQFPGVDGDRRGFAYQLDQPHLEDDSFDSLPGLLTVPQNKFNGYIQATYPEFTVQQGDKLQTLVNCEFGVTGCTVTFRIDYLLPNGAQYKLWQWKETADKRFYRANIDLSALAGKNVRFVFMLLASGYASNDRAIWGSPRIVRTDAPPPPPSTLTLLPPSEPTLPPPTLAPTGCDRASFITDVNVPDGSTFAPNAPFSKTWRLKNSGKCAWTTGYKLTYYSGSQMSAPASVNLPFTVYPGSTADLTVNMVAPDAAGNYRGFWILSNASGTPFGIGTNAANPFWVDIQVVGNSFNENGYDFWANACVAQWKSGAGPLPCPGTEGDTKGFVVASSYTQLEDGTVGPAPSLLMSPQNKYNGYIQGFYPAITVEPGDRFHAVVGCEKGYSCYATFRLDYMNPNGYIGNFWSWRESNDKKNNVVDVDLTPLAGRSVKFILTILATGSANGDRVRWVAPYLLRRGGAPATITPAPSTITPPTNNWLTFNNSTYGFQFKYPPEAQIFNQFPESLLMNLPITQGTNLTEKYLQAGVTQNTGTCQSPLPQPPYGTSETVTINGISFLKQTGGDAGAGNFHEWVAYSTVKGTNCISLSFVLHSLNAGSFDPPIPEFDRTAESAVFTQMMSTFTFPPPPTDTNTPHPPTVTLPPPTETFTPAPPVASPNIRSLHMIDALNGWALSDQYVIRTTDGGNTWYPVLFESMPATGYFASSTKAWVVSNAYELIRTTDGGLNWTRYSVPFNSGYIQFLDDNNGFVLHGEGSGMQKQAVALYQTTDGGATWTLKYNNDPTISNPGTTLPFSGHKNGMTFRNTTTGWVGGDYPVNGTVYLYKTTNSGVTWSQVSLSLPTGYQSAFFSTTAPKFFDANNGILPVWMTSGAGMKDLYLYKTTNGGSTWTRSTSFARNAEHTEINSMTNTISWDWANKFFVTNNAGASWTSITPNTYFGDGFRQVDFVSPTTGWARLQNLEGLTTLYRTTDGGATWTHLYGPQPVPPTQTPAPPTPTITPTAPVSSLKAKVTADKLSCRYGPGAEYLYLYALNKDANITLIGRTDANNWVWVSGTNKCWVNANYLTITGDRNALPIVYPTGIAKIPVSPYYPAPAWASAVRNGNSVGVSWAAVPISAGDYEDSSMHQYILEVWRCEAGQIIFETLGSNTPSIVVPKDEPGCSVPSHGRVYVQEKHGYAGPVEPPWPQPNQPVTATPIPNPTTLVQSVVTALNARNFSAVNSAMDQTFILSLWQSQGTAYTPDLALEQLQLNYLGTTSLTLDLSKNLTSLLGGSDPFAVAGLDPSKSQAYYVSGWGTSGVGEAILYFTQRANGSPYWHSILIAPGGFAPGSTSVSHDVFCVDTRVPFIISQLKAGMNQSNGSVFSTFVSPTHGLDVRLWAYAAPVNFNATSVSNIFANTTSYNWGGGPSGIPDTGTFKDLLHPKLLEVLNAPNMETYCDTLTKVYPLSNPWPYPDIRYYNLYKPGTPGVELDFRTLLIGFEYINDQPYLHSLVTIAWEP